MNKIFIIGNLTRDPETRTVTNGASVCTFTVAVNRKFADADGNKGFMVTNASNPFDGITASYAVQFDKDYDGVLVCGKDGQEIYELDANWKITLELGPGEGNFLIPLVYTRTSG